MTAAEMEALKKVMKKIPRSEAFRRDVQLRSLSDEKEEGKGKVSHCQR